MSWHCTSHCTSHHASHRTWREVREVVPLVGGRGGGAPLRQDGRPGAIVLPSHPCTQRARLAGLVPSFLAETTTGPDLRIIILLARVRDPETVWKLFMFAWLYVCIFFILYSVNLPQLLACKGFFSSTLTLSVKCFSRRFLKGKLTVLCLFVYCAWAFWETSFSVLMWVL